MHGRALLLFKKLFALMRTRVARQDSRDMFFHNDVSMFLLSVFSNGGGALRHLHENNFEALVLVLKIGLFCFV